MMPTRYSIFEPSTTKFKLSRNVIGYGLVIIGFATMLSPIKINETFRIYYILLTFVVFLYFLITSLWSYEPLRGEINGELEFRPNSLIINELEYKTSDLDEIYLHYEDYFGEKKHYIKGDLNQNIRQGVGNYIYFSDASGSEHIYYFRVENEEDAQKLLPFIKRYNA